VPAEQRDATVRSASRLTHSDFERGIKSVIKSKTASAGSKIDGASPHPRQPLRVRFFSAICIAAAFIFYPALMSPEPSTRNTSHHT
jgi:hypothetical protein